MPCKRATANDALLVEHDLFRKPLHIPDRVEDMLFGICSSLSLSWPASSGPPSSPRITATPYILPGSLIERV